MFGWEFPPFNSGGLGVASEGIARSLADLGAELTLVVPKRLPLSFPYARLVSAEIEKLTMYGIHSELHPYKSTGTHAVLADGTPVYGKDLPSQVRAYAHAAKKIAAEIPHDVIYAHDWLSFGAGMEAKSLSGKPLIAHVHATEYERNGENGGNEEIYALERAGIHAADRVIAVSGRTRNAIVSQYGVPPAKVAVVHNGIDEKSALSGGNPDTSRLKVLKDAGYKLVLFMGRLTLQKGPDYLLKAAKRVLEYDDKVMFVIAGAGDMERALVRQAAELGIGDNVLFPGFLRGAEQHEACALADLFVMPSVSEPFGLSALEAMRLGVPALVSKQSGIAEATKHVLTSDFWDTEEMANKILFTLHAKNLKRMLAREGRRESERLSWGAAAGKIRGLFNDALAPAPAPAFAYA